MAEPIYFDDTEYVSRVFDGVNKPDEKLPIDGPLKIAHDIRKFEIELFWKRGTYYWAFILGAFTAHFALLGMLFDKDSCREFSLEKFFNLSGMSLFSLAITALFCFIFSFSWCLVNKGSKFWQENWEEHIYHLENDAVGRLYKTYLNSKKKEKFGWFPLSCEAYSYSVTKVTMLTSSALCIFSLVLTLFYIIVMFVKMKKYYVPFLEWFMWIVIPGILLLLLFGIVFVFIKFGKSSNYKGKTNKEKKWYQRPL